jgi:hypothetical protein
VPRVTTPIETEAVAAQTACAANEIETELGESCSDCGRELLPALYQAVREQRTTRANPRITEWKRLFGHAAGVQTDQLKKLLKGQSEAHGVRYDERPDAYLFALNTSLALITKLVAALSLPGTPDDLRDATVPIRERIALLESGRPFTKAGIFDFLSGDVFSWYADHPSWKTFEGPIVRILERLGGVSFGAARQTPESTRDLFKGVYQSLIPRALRHALGEFYTPDWLAAHALDVIEWDSAEGLIDPTCGSGTFLLEALKRRLSRPDAAGKTAAELLDGLYGLDLNPLAVLAARASLVVALSDRFDPRRPVRLPVFLVDAILAEPSAVATVPRSRYVCGNPPWVKWSQLPPEYAALVKERCLQGNIFSTDAWVGGIESDISTVITYEAIEKWLAPDGVLAFVITGTVFANESSQGFRRFRLQGADVDLRVLRVEDFADVAPFEGVNNHATLLVVQRDRTLKYPVRYRVWKAPRDGRRVTRSFASARDFAERASHVDLQARPVPGTDAGPWLKGTARQHALWRRLFGGGESAYQARKGITTDLNGAFFVRIISADSESVCTIRNNPRLGRKTIPTVTTSVESEHLFPLLRGRGVQPFVARVDPEYRVLLPQRGMHGDPQLATTARQTYRYLARFRKKLEERSSYRRFQRSKPYWSVWSTGPYTFDRFKVAWKEMPGGKFAAAYVGEHADPVLGPRVVVPDHKVYFIPMGNDEDAAAYLTALLNAPTIAEAISAYAAQLSLGASVAEYLNIPRYDAANSAHRALSALGVMLTREGRGFSEDEGRALDDTALSLFPPKR